MKIPNFPSDNKRSQEEMYGHIPLTPEEEAEAILEGKRKKFFWEKHRADWEEYEIVIKREKRIAVKGYPPTGDD